MPLALWLLTFTLLTRLAQTSNTVPYLALGAEMAHDYHQRSTLYSLGYLPRRSAARRHRDRVLPLFPTTPPYTPGLLNPRGYQGFSISFAAVIVAAIFVCAAGTWREIPHLASSGRAVAGFSIAQLIRETAEAFGNRSFRALFFGMSLATVMLAIESVLNPYMGVHFWGLRTRNCVGYRA